MGRLELGQQGVGPLGVVDQAEVGHLHVLGLQATFQHVDLAEQLVAEPLELAPVGVMSHAEEADAGRARPAAGMRTAGAEGETFMVVEFLCVIGGRENLGKRPGATNRQQQNHRGRRIQETRSQPQRPVAEALHDGAGVEIGQDAAQPAHGAATPITVPTAPCGKRSPMSVT